MFQIWTRPEGSALRRGGPDTVARLGIVHTWHSGNIFVLSLSSIEKRHEDSTCRIIKENQVF
jgi:hypothetical protein